MSKITSIIREDADFIVEHQKDVFDALGNARVLLTGAAGFLGSFFLDVFDAYNRRHPATPIHVVALDTFIAALPERVAHFAKNPHIALRKHDVTKPLEGSEKFDFIIHAASIASPIAYRQHPLETIDANVNGTWRMLELAQAQKSRSVLFLSSSEIYGDPDPQHIPTKETYWGNVSSTGPRACYDESKRLGETLCTTFFRQHGTPVKIIRPFNVYGPGQRLNDQRIIPDMMRDAIKGGPLVLLSDGKPTRSFCYLRDFISGCLRLFVFGQNGESYNLGNDEEISIRALAELVAAVAGKGKPLEVRFETSKDSDYLRDNPNRRCPDLGKAREAVGYKPIVGLREGLQRTLQSHLEAGAS